MITLFAAISMDGFIADAYGNGDFSSAEDKAQFYSHLRSPEIDAFILGRKTFDEFSMRLSYKPSFVFTKHVREYNTPVTLISDYSALPKMRYALLGGSEIYKYFLSQNLVDKVYLTTEKNIFFHNGLSLDFDKYKHNFKLEKSTLLSQNTLLNIYKKIHK